MKTNIPASTLERVRGRKVFIDGNGHEVFTHTADQIRDGTVRERHNGPHHDAKWAKDLLGTNFTQGELRKQAAVRAAKDKLIGRNA